MSAWGLNTYLYAPKDDLKHRALWREPYSPKEEEALRKGIHRCQQRGLRFVYGLSPGLDIHYSQQSDLALLKQRFAQMLALGCHDFALLFDDIPDCLEAADRERWGSFASAQCQVTNTLFRWTRERGVTGRFLFCPTPYCGRMARAKLGGDGYLATLGRELALEIDVFWTGPEIVSPEIPLAHVEELRTILRRRPLLWDNLFANDYDGRRFFCGPYAGRPLELREAVGGFLVNPNNEFPLNCVPLRTFADFVHCAGPWEPRAAYLSAMRQWLPEFATASRPMALEDLVMLGDCYYLPHQEGPEAEALFEGLRRLLSTRPSQWSNEAMAFQQRATRLRDGCARLAELRNRPLFHALTRRTWELREELELLLGYVRLKTESGNPDAPARSDFHLPGTYRGGLVARLQRLLIQHPDGTFTASPEAFLGNTAGTPGAGAQPSAGASSNQSSPVLGRAESPRSAKPGGAADGRAPKPRRGAPAQARRS